MTVRRLREDEIPTLVDDLWFPLAREMADLDAYNALADDPRDYALAHRREQFRDDDSATFVAEREGALAGHVHVKRTDPAPVFERGPEGTISEVYVAPDYRGQGIADALMDRAEAWAADRGCEYVSLSVNEDNETARRVYESRGYSTRRRKMDKWL